MSAYLRDPNTGKLKFSILWENYDKMLRSFEDWDAMVMYCESEYFSKPEFLRVDSKPVVFVFSADMLKKCRIIWQDDQRLQDASRCQ